MTLPNFIVIGAGRSGTTSLHHYLGQHPEIYLCPEKSPNFFVSDEVQPEWEGPTVRRMAQHWVRDRGAYEALFDRARGERAIGEASPVYLQALSAAPAIAKLCPDARLVAILRDPVDRAYTHFLGRRRDGLDSRVDFREVVAEERSRPLPDSVAFGNYLGCGRYHHFLGPYFELFPRERIRVYLYDDLVSDAHGLLADLFAFLDVDPTFVPSTEKRHAQTGVIENSLLRAVWTGSVSLRTAVRPYLPAVVRDLGRPIFARRLAKEHLEPELRAELIEVFRDDIGRLQGLIGRDLKQWLT